MSAAAAYTSAEMMAVAAARMLRDDDVCFVHSVRLLAYGGGWMSRFELLGHPIGAAVPMLVGDVGTPVVAVLEQQ